MEKIVDRRSLQQQDLGDNFTFSPDNAALESILSLQGVARQTAPHPTTALTPAREIPGNFRNSEKLEFFENKNGNVFFRRKVVATKSPGVSTISKSTYKRNLGKVPCSMQPVRIPPRNVPPRTGNKVFGDLKGFSTSRTPLAPKTDNRQVPATTNKPVVIVEPTLFRQSLSEQKPPSQFSRRGIPVPISHARKNLQFKKPTKITHPMKPKVNKATLPPTFPKGVAKESKQQQPLIQSSLKRLTRESIQSLPRESLAWMSQLPRESATFAELLKMMNEQEKGHVNDDHTDAFEAMEKRMKTPSKSSKVNQPLLQASLRRLTRDSILPVPRESLAWMSQLPRESATFAELLKMMNEEEKEIVNDDQTGSFEAMEKRMKTPKKTPKKSLSKHFNLSSDGFDENKENGPKLATSLSNINCDSFAKPSFIEPLPFQEDVGNLTSYKGSSELLSDNCLTPKSSKPPSDKKFNSNVPERSPVLCPQIKDYPLTEGISPLMRSLSMTELEISPQPKDKPLHLHRAASVIDIPEGSSAVLSGLVPAQEVQEVLEDLTSCQEQLEKFRKQQDELNKQSEQVMDQIKQRKQQFKELWGVSPLRINTKRTVIPKRLKCGDMEVGEHKETSKSMSLVEPVGQSTDMDVCTPEIKRLEVEPKNTDRKVRFNSGNNCTLVLTPNTHLEEEPSQQIDSDEDLSQQSVKNNMTDRRSINNQSFASLKSSFSFMQTPLATSGHTVTRKLQSQLGTTPAALKCLKSRVEAEFAALYAADSDDSPTQFTQPAKLEF